MDLGSIVGGVVTKGYEGIYKNPMMLAMAGGFTPWELAKHFLPGPSPTSAAVTGRTCREPRPT